MENSIPWTNCRLVLEEDEDKDADLPQGIVARLFYTEESHPAVKQSLQSLKSMTLSLHAIALQNLINKRGPDGLIGAIPGSSTAASRHAQQLLHLCQRCTDTSTVLFTSIPAADVVLVPRSPEAAARDGLYFIAYATNVKAVQMCERLRQERRVALILDIDNTLIDACPVSAATAEEWDHSLNWINTEVENSSGKHIPGQFAALIDEDDDTCEGAYAIRWKMSGRLVLFKVRIRKGWSHLHDFLAAGKNKYLVSVCSKGKAEYVQLIWTFLDPGNRLIPRSAWPIRVNSTFPDTLQRAAPKTALLALGCASPGQPVLPTQLAAPIMCLDDSSEAYSHEYLNSVVFVEEYRPSEFGYGDSGSVLQAVRSALEAFWESACGTEGTFAWQAAQSFAGALLGATQRMPMESPDALAYLQTRCRKQGELLHRQITVEAVFGHQPLIVDASSPVSTINNNSDDAEIYFGGNGGASQQQHKPLGHMSIITPEKAAAAAASLAAGNNKPNIMTTTGARPIPPPSSTSSLPLSRSPTSSLFRSISAIPPPSSLSTSAAASVMLPGTSPTQQQGATINSMTMTHLQLSPRSAGAQAGTLAAARVIPTEGPLRALMSSTGQFGSLGSDGGGAGGGGFLTGTISPLGESPGSPGFLWSNAAVDDEMRGRGSPPTTKKENYV